MRYLTPLALLVTLPVFAEPPAEGDEQVELARELLPPPPRGKGKAKAKAQ